MRRGRELSLGVPKRWNGSLFGSPRDRAAKPCAPRSSGAGPPGPLTAGGCAAGRGFSAPLAGCGRSRSPFNSRLLPAAAVHSGSSRNFQVPRAELRRPSSGALGAARNPLTDSMCSSSAAARYILERCCERGSSAPRAVRCCVFEC